MNEEARGGPPERNVHNELPGTVHGVAAQFGAVYGDVHISGAETTDRGGPRLVPQVGWWFVNRELERRDVRALLRSDNSGQAPIIVLTGLPGVGKTVTAHSVAWELAADFPGGLLYVDYSLLRSDEGTAVSDGLAECLRALGVVEEKAMPTTLSGRTSLFRRHTQDNAVLVVLDNVREAAEVRPFVPSAPGSAVLVTSNNHDLSEPGLHAKPFLLEPLRADAAVELLAAQSERDDVSDAEWHELASLCGGLPVVLAVAAGRLRKLRSLLVGEFVEDIQHSDSGLRGFHLPSSQIAVFDATYHALPAEGAKLYRRLALVPVVDFSLDVVAAIEETSISRARSMLEALIDASLIQDNGTGRYAQHDLIRRHARECAEAEETTEQQRDVLWRVAENYLLRMAFADLVVMGSKRLRITEHAELALPEHEDPFAGEKTRALDWFEAEHSNLLAVLRTCVSEGWNRPAWQLAEAMTGLYPHRRYLTDWLECTALGVRAAELDNEPAAVARLRSFGTRASSDLGDLRTVRPDLEGALSVAQEIGDRRLEASIWELFGRYYDEAAKAGDDSVRGLAVESYERALELFQAENDQRGEAFVRYFLGCALDDHFRSEQALGTLLRAQEQVKDVPDRRMEGRVLTSIGKARLRRGEHDGARSALHEAIGLFQQGGDTYYEAQAQEVLAEVALATGEDESRRQSLERALTLHASFGGPRAAELRERLASLGG